MDMKLEFTDCQITPWGGMGLMKRMLDLSRRSASATYLRLAATEPTGPNS